MDDVKETVKQAFDDFSNSKYMDAKDKLKAVLGDKVAAKLNTELGLQGKQEVEPEPEPNEE